MKPRLLAIAWMFVILAGMSIPTTALPVSRLLTADKLLHFGCFFGLTLLWLRALGGSTRRRVIVALAIGVGYGAFTELYQGIMPIGRTADLFDLLADAVGSLCALPFARQLRKENAPSNPAAFIVS